MSPSRSRIIIALFVLLSGGVAVNVHLQQKSPPRVASALPFRTEQARPAATEPARKLAAARLEDGIDRLMAFAAEPSPKAEAKPPQNPIKAVRAAQAGGAAEPGDGSDVALAIQRELKQRGYEPGAVDGVVGLVTRAAIMAFERDNRMALTGEPSDALLKAIVVGPSPQIAAAHAATMTGEKRQRAELVVRTIQQSLTAIGYNSGKASGQISEETERAIREFEMDQGLPVTGRISGRLVNRLVKVTGNSRLATAP